MSTPQWAQDINSLNTTDTDLSPSQTIVWGVRMKTESDKFTAVFKGLSMPLQNAIANAGTAQTLGEDATDKRLSNLTRADAVANLIQTTTAGLAGVVGQVIRISNSTGGLDTTPINMGATLSINETTGDPFYIMTLDRKDTFGDSRVLEETRGFRLSHIQSITPEPPSGTALTTGQFLLEFLVIMNNLPTGVSFSRTVVAQSGDVAIQLNDGNLLDGRIWSFNPLKTAVNLSLSVFILTPHTIVCEGERSVSVVFSEFMSCAHCGVLMRLSPKCQQKETTWCHQLIALYSSSKRQTRPLWFVTSELI